MALDMTTDLIAGVIAAGDPARQQLAAKRLQAMASEGVAASAVAPASSPAVEDGLEPTVTVADSRPFSDVLAEVAAPKAEPAASVRSGVEEARIALLNRETATAARTPPSAQAAEQFEAVALQAFLGAMMPPAAAAMAGGGTAGSMWSSLLTEHIAAAMARAGGVGIAAMLAQGQEKPTS